MRTPGQLAKETADNKRQRWMIEVPKIAGKPAGADSVMDALAFGDCPWQKWPRMHLGTHALVPSYVERDMDSVLSTTVRGAEYVPRYVRGTDGWIDWSHLPNHFEPTHAQPPSTALQTLPTARRQTLNDARKVVFTIITKPRHVLSRPRVQRRQSLRTRRPAPPHPLKQYPPCLPPLQPPPKSPPSCL